MLLSASWTDGEAGNLTNLGHMLMRKNLDQFQWTKESAINHVVEIGAHANKENDDRTSWQITMSVNIYTLSNSGSKTGSLNTIFS